MQNSTSSSDESARENKQNYEYNTNKANKTNDYGSCLHLFETHHKAAWWKGYCGGDREPSLGPIHKTSNHPAPIESK